MDRFIASIELKKFICCKIAIRMNLESLSEILFIVFELSKDVFLGIDPVTPQWECLAKEKMKSAYSSDYYSEKRLFNNAF